MGEGLRGRWNLSPRGLFHSFFAERLSLPQGLFWSDVDLTDVSFWQGQIDFGAMKRSGIRGVFIRAGQGAWVDRRWMDNWTNARQWLPRGSYWFFDSRTTPKAQADLYCEVTKEDRGELPMVVDYEENYRGRHSGWRNLYDMIERMRANDIPQKRIWIYTGYWYWMANSPTKTAQLNYFRQYKLWLSSYTTNPKRVRIPRPWMNEDVILWQWGTPVEGIERGTQSKEIDMNKFMGDESDYASLLKGLRYGNV